MEKLESINGINLANYFPNRQAYNSVVYVHKKFYLPDEIESNETHHKKKPSDVKKQISPKTASKPIKAKDAASNNTTVKNRLKDDSVLQQTIKFAKNIVPIVMPPPKTKSPIPVYYTVKASKKSAKKTRKTLESSSELNDLTYDKEKTKSIQESNKSEKVVSNREHFKVRTSESITSQNNTIDELNMNHSSSYTVSELSGKKFVTKNRTQNKNYDSKIVTSESFEALATDLMNSTGNGKIKIYLMDDKDKNSFCETIMIPVMKAVNKYFNNSNNLNSSDRDVKYVQKIVENNKHKLDDILEKLKLIENKINIQTKTKSKSVNSSKQKNTVKLEEQEEDLPLMEKASSSEELLQECDLEGNPNPDSVLEIFSPKQGFMKSKRRLDCLNRGEEPLTTSSSVMQISVKPERQARLPARFCWTDCDRRD